MSISRGISLKSAWYGLIILLTLLPVAVLLPWIGPKAFDLLQEKALLAESQFNENIRDHVEAEISRMVTMLTNKTDPIAYTLSEEDYDASLLQALLGKVLQREHSVFALMLLDSRGHVISGMERHDDVISSVSAEHPRSLAEDRIDSRSAALVIPLHGRTYIGSTNNRHGSASFHVAVPVGGERPSAVLLADIDAKLFWHEVEDKLSRRGVITYLVDRRGSLLNVPPGVVQHKGDLLTHLPIVRALLADQEWVKERDYTGLNGEQVFGVVSPIEMLNWGVISEVPTRTITYPIATMLSVIAFIVVALMALVGIAGLWLVNKMLRRMLNLSQAFQAIANGDYNQHLSSSPFAEVADLIAAVNRMSQDLQHREDALRQSEQRLQAILDNSTAVICMKDVEGRYLLVNRYFEELFSVSKDEAEGRSDRDLFPPLMAQAIRDNDLQVIRSRSPMEFEEQVQLGDESRTYISVKFPLTERNGEVYAVCSISTDITQRMRDEARLEYLAYHDVLTGLANRALFLDRLEHALNRRHPADRMLAVIFMDLDRFKYINDTLGHEIGDHLLQDLARRLGECLRKSDTIARFGGDEFAILLEDLESSEAISVVAEQLLEIFTRPFHLQGHEFYMTTSIGISIFPDDCDDAGCLLKNADTAMYRAKEMGRNIYQYYSVEMGNQTLERLRLETDLRHATEQDQFYMVYQPQIDLGSGRVIGVEALIRWRHPELGLMSPLKFIHILEEMGMIVAVGDWVLEQACTQAGIWQRNGNPGLRMAVNLSGRQFHDPLLHERIRHILAETGVAASTLELEITEGVLMQQDQVTMANLKALQRMGVRLSIDDFGTGYSSLSYLKRFPISTLKIDRSFIRDLADDPEDAAIVRAIIAMAQSLKLEIIAEGVETEQQLAFLNAQGCDAVQGYLFSAPLATDEVGKYLESGAGAACDVISQTAV